jgi:hypothetical protein
MPSRASDRRYTSTMAEPKLSIHHFYRIRLQQSAPYIPRPRREAEDSQDRPDANVQRQGPASNPGLMHALSPLFDVGQLKSSLQDRSIPGTQVGFV